MAVSKRLRYEVLRRDNHTCRYCGATAPDAPLRVDHVTPVALGGADTPNNLVTACEPCNSGKTSTSPSADLVADVEQDALRWSIAMQKAAANLLEQEKPKLEYRQAFLDEWNRWGYGEGNDRKAIDLPGNWKPSLERFRVAGLPACVWSEIVDTAMGFDKVRDKFKYCCGIAWNKVTAMQRDAQTIVADEDPVSSDAVATVRNAVSAHLYSTWTWAWERIGAGSPNDNDRHDFAEDLNELLERGLSAELDLTEMMFLSGADHATDPSSYLPLEFMTPEQAASLAPLTAEEYTSGDYVLGLWSTEWEAHSQEGGPTAREERDFSRQVSEALRAGVERDWILNAARLAGGFMSTDLSYYLPKPDVQGGAN